MKLRHLRRIALSVALGLSTLGWFASRVLAQTGKGSVTGSSTIPKPVLLPRLGPTARVSITWAPFRAALTPWLSRKKASRSGQGRWNYMLGRMP